MDAVRSPLTVFAGDQPRQASKSSTTELTQLIRLTRERRTQVARQMSGTTLPSGELARLHTERQLTLDRLLQMADAAPIKADLRALNADWGRLERATDHPQIDASGMFVLHSLLIDKQLALLSTLADPSS
jgi:hypothetical protein